MNTTMAILNALLFLALPSLFQSIPLSLSRATDTLTQGSSMSVERSTTDVLVSPNGVFSAGFFPVGENAFCFAVWFKISSAPTVVWMANRDQPVNGKGSTLSLTIQGNLVLVDAGITVLWTTDTPRNSPVSTASLKLEDNGNLVLISTTSWGKKSTLWESFKSPMDTLLPGQKLTFDLNLVSSKSQTNYSSGYYRLFFDDDNVLKLLFRGADRKISSIYWPPPWLRNFDNGRSIYNSTKTAELDSSGFFSSSDNLLFKASDYGENRRRRLKLDPDGNLRLYSFDMNTSEWFVTWQAVQQPCVIHGICGANSFCSYDHALGRRCNCVPGFKVKNHSDWFSGCEPDFEWKNYIEDVRGFLRVPNSEFYGQDRNYFPNRTLRECEEECLKLPDCQGFQFKFTGSVYDCFHKSRLLNGQSMEGFNGDMYIRVPKADISSYYKPREDDKLRCPKETAMLDREYKRPRENGTLKALLWVAVGLAGVEFLCASVVTFFLYSTRSKVNEDRKTQGYMFAAARFQKFTYAEMRKATKEFSEEIGSGGGGKVYKSVLADGRVAAIKQLREANQGEAEFLAEVSTIGRLNHMNLIEMWGYCAEEKHRLLVYEYMEHGSLADSLISNALSWEKRFEIAVGTAKGLAYLHEECLEWVLHCDVKPHNILLDSNYQAKVADFGLSKLQSRGETHSSSFSRIRGTRGYMAPEWVYNLPITSKVDVYSYGIVVLELVTGRNPRDAAGFGGGEEGRLVTWVREKMSGGAEMEEIADAVLGGEFDRDNMEVVIKVAFQCVEEDREARPTMKQVVEMLQCREDDRAIIFG